MRALLRNRKKQVKHTKEFASIPCYMKLLEQILGELGGDTLKAFTVVPGFGGYFRSVKNIVEYSRECVVLVLRKAKITLEGEELEVGKYFEEDLFIKGDIRGIKIENR